MKRSAPIGFIDGAGLTVAERAKRAKKMQWSEVRPGGYDAKARTAFMDRDGIAAELIYASLGMALCIHRDMDYKDACMKAYNRWLQGFCADAPDRLFGLAMTAVRDVDSAIEDFRRAKEMGMADMMMTSFSFGKRSNAPPSTMVPTTSCTARMMPRNALTG